jgi:hypothetical protein
MFFQTAKIHKIMDVQRCISSEKIIRTAQVRRKGPIGDDRTKAGVCPLLRG